MKKKELLLSDCQQCYNLLPEAIFFVQQDGKILLVNWEFDDFMLRKKGAKTKKSIFNYFPLDKKKLKETLKKVFTEHQKTHKVIIPCTNAKGDNRSFEVKIRYSQGKAALGVVYDVSERVKTKKELEKEKEQLEETVKTLTSSYQRLGQVNAQISSLLEINTTFSSSLSWEDKFDRILKAIKSFTMANGCILRVLDTKKQVFTVVRYLGLSQEWEKSKLPLDDPLMKQLVASHQPIKIDFTRDKKFSCINLAKKDDMKGAIFIPVILSDQVVAIFALYFNDIQKLESLDANLALTYTSSLAIAVMMTGYLDNDLKNIF